MLVEWGDREGEPASIVMRSMHGSLFGGRWKSFDEVSAETGLPEQLCESLWRDGLRAIVRDWKASPEAQEARSIKEAYLRGETVDEIVAAGHDRAVVEEVIDTYERCGRGRHSTDSR
ncbi:MAG: hypothetical protein M3138_06925 [Actinomycetota bacterium]|nr:hypothetical protein [Actinomycetota bacterium]